MDIHGKVLTLNEVHSVSPVPTPFTEVVGFCLRGQHLVLVICGDARWESV